jgi:hypothetical protein
MISRSLTVQKAHLNLASFVITMAMLLAACESPPSSGITIAQNDATAPTLTFGIGQPSGQNVTVSVGGSAGSLKLIGKTGPLNLLATAKDPESGIQTVQIWVNATRTNCQPGGVCSATGPGLLGKPQFESTSQPKKPGETTAESSIMAEAFELSKEIPQGSVTGGGSLTVEFTFYAVAVNHLGGRVQSPVITATWTEP